MEKSIKVAIVGSSGYIAGFLKERFKSEECITQTINIDRSKNSDLFIDLENAEIFDYSKLRGIDYIIFTAAISGPDLCAKEFERCWKINVTGTSFFIKNAIEQGCKVLFFSSDAVYGQDCDEIFDENSMTNASTPYGKMKKAVEDEFKKNPSFKAIRLSYVVSAKDKFTSYCLSCIREKRKAEIFHPFYRNCITITDVLDSVCWLIKNWYIFDSFVLNIAGIELVSRVRIADEINRYFYNSLEYTIKVPDVSFFANRPKITQMKSLYLYEKGIVSKLNFTNKIQKELEAVEL